MCVVALTSGCIFDSDNDSKSDSTKKGSVSGTVKLTVSGDPVVGMKVYLINTKISVDPTDADAILSRSAFVDSAVTDANGKYSITNITPGTYGVTPVNEDSTTVYTFTQSASSDSCVFSMNGNNRSVNFIAEKKDYTGIINKDSDLITDSITFENIAGYYNNGGEVSMVILRRSWLISGPILEVTARRVFSDLYKVDTKYLPGHYSFFSSLDNFHYYTITTPNPTKVHKIYIDHPLSTPAGSVFNYTFDLDTDTLTETK